MLIQEHKILGGLNMEIIINPVAFSASAQLEQFIREKISRLEKYNDAIIKAVVTLKLEKDDKLENKVVEVSFSLKGQDIFVQKNAKKFEEAVDGLYDVLKRQLVKAKEKSTDK